MKLLLYLSHCKCTFIAGLAEAIWHCSGKAESGVCGLFVWGTVLRGALGMPTERLYRGVLCRDVKLSSRFLPVSIIFPSSYQYCPPLVSLFRLLPVCRCLSVMCYICNEQKNISMIILWHSQSGCYFIYLCHHKCVYITSHTPPTLGVVVHLVSLY